VIEARFDDLTPDGASFRLVGPVGVLEAHSLGEVLPTIRAAEAAAARGLWVAGLVAYEAAPAMDPALVVRGRPAGDPFAELPLAWFAMFEGAEETRLPTPPDHAPAEAGGAWEPSIDRARYARAIAAIQERIAAGDTYQVNFTFRLRSTVEGDERGLYRDLCHAQRGAYGAFLNLGRYRVLSASPELFVAAEGGRLVTKPMKGTAPRGRWPDEDERTRDDLVRSAKDRAENAMIVDLLRNDLGRVSREGSVSWSDLFEAERFETVWQLTSTVTSTLRPGADLADVFAALFPSGSVTGAPKVRTTELIAGLEDLPRGVYCGAVGYLAPGGDGPRARFNVAIRTVTVDAETRTAEYGVGGGITWDSRSANEYDETVAKARVLTARRPRFDLLETLAYEPSEGYRRLDAHLARLRASAGYFGFAVDEDAVRASLEREAARASERPLRVRLEVGRDGRVRLGSAPLVAGEGPVSLEVDRDEPVDRRDVLLFHKTSRRTRYDAARARHPDADDVILTNREGRVTETTIANLAVRLDGRWWTPPLDDGLLPGVERAALLADGTLAERSIAVEELEDAEELAVLSSVRGFRPAALRGRQSVASRPSSGKT
jgi:para-aminobenzoate synthetase/4-amino-4-deoxychorismate lyase